NTREALSGKPRLSLFLSANGLYAWNKNASGTWSSAANWDAGAPTAGAGSVALLSDIITTPRNVTFDTAATVGELRFDGTNAYTLTGTPTLTLDGGGGAGSAISAFKGSHKLDVPVSITTATTVDVEAG